MAGVTALIAAEKLKIEGRKPVDAAKFVNQTEFRFLEQQFEQEQQDIFGRKAELNMGKSVQSKAPLSGPEVMQDITKWIAYDTLQPGQASDHNPILVAALFEALSGRIAYAVCELLSRRSSNVFALSDAHINFFQSSIEGAALFATYEGSIAFFWKAQRLLKCTLCCLLISLTFSVEMFIAQSPLPLPPPLLRCKPTVTIHRIFSSNE